MADFMDKLVSGINKSVANMSAGSKNISEKNKMNSEIKRLGEEIKEISSSLGINVYNYCATNPDKDIPTEQFATFIREISVRNHQINNCRNTIAALDAEMERMKNEMNSERLKKQVKTCSCGTVNPGDAKFCSGCGSPLE